MDLQNPKKILVVQIGKIGDMILTTPLFSGLKILFPDSILKVLASEINKDIPLNHSSVDEVIIYNKNILKNLLLLKSSIHNIDLWIDPKDNYSRTSELLLKIFNPKKSLGFNITKNIFDVSLSEYQAGKHAVDINLSAFNCLNISGKKFTLKPSFNIPLEIQEKFSPDFQESNNLKLLINISAGNDSRYLVKEVLLEVINKINAFGLTYFTLTGLNKDKEIINYLLENFRGRNIKYIETKNILEISEVIKLNDIVITPDTSVVHICSAFDKPVLALYPDVKWNLEKFTPLSEYCEVLISKDKNSLKDISADEIVNGFLQLKGKLNSGNAESRTRVRKEDH